MKKKLITISIITLLAACGGNTATKDDSKTTTANNETAKTDISSNPDYEKGLDLIGKNDCLTCHKISEKLIGPAYQEVANKYENTPANVTMLAEKIIKGGTGVWGQTAMTAHAQLSQADAEQMVKYILLLKTN